MVQADVAGEELQHARQLQVGAALQRGVGEAPVLACAPSRRPRTGAARRTARCRPRRRAGRRRLHEQVLAPTDEPAERPDEQGQGDVRADDAAADARRASRAGSAGWTISAPRTARTRTSRTGCGTAGSEAPAPRPTRVLGDGQRGHVADAAPIEVAGGRVVDRVVVAPPLRTARRPRSPRTVPEPRVRAPRRHERAVRAVVEDDEVRSRNPAAGTASASTSRYETSSARYISDRQRHVGHDRGRDVQHRAAEVRSGVRGERFPPEGASRARFASRRRARSRLIDARPGVRALDGGQGAHPLPCAAFRGAP